MLMMEFLKIARPKDITYIVVYIATSKESEYQSLLIMMRMNHSSDLVNIFSLSPCRRNHTDEEPFSFFPEGGGDGAFPEHQWCIADEQTPDNVLQVALDWACGPGGADCSLIQPNKPCFLPNNMKNHASYAFNSYWQKFKNKGGSCYFNGAAMVTDLDPSHGACHITALP